MGKPGSMCALGIRYGACGSPSMCWIGACLAFGLLLWLTGADLYFGFARALGRDRGLPRGTFSGGCFMSCSGATAWISAVDLARFIMRAGVPELACFRARFPALIERTMDEIVSAILVCMFFGPAGSASPSVDPGVCSLRGSAFRLGADSQGAELAPASVSFVS
eukprot:scaffold55_cov237-Pinguiococcus_pyrenoidosus.AAC.3